jgi:hypothetical protein
MQLRGYTVTADPRFYVALKDDDLADHMLWVENLA